MHTGTFLLLAALACPVAIAQTPGDAPGQGGVIPPPVQEPLVAFKPAVERPLKKIAIMGIGASRQVRVMNQNIAGTSFGILPALAYGGEIDRKSKEYSEEMNRRKMTLALDLANSLQRTLKAKYEIVWIRERGKLREDKTVDYSHIKVDADAILVVWYGIVGWLANYTDKDYYTQLHLAARLMDGSTKDTLYYKQFAVLPVGQRHSDRIEVVNADPNSRYRTWEDLIGNFDQSIEALRLAQDKLVEQIARDLGVTDIPPAPPRAQPPAAAPATSGG